MKSFYCVICLLAVMLFAIGINYFYIERFSENMMQVCEQLDTSKPRETSLERVLWVQDQWHKNKKFIQITVNHTEIELIDNAVDELLVFAKQGDEADFENAKQFAINAFEELSLSERLTLTNIL